MGKNLKQTFLQNNIQMANKHMKRFSILLIIRGMQIKTTMRHHISQNQFNSPQFTSITQSCLPLCKTRNCSSPGFPVQHQLQEAVQTHAHLTISSSVVPFSSCLQSFPALRSFPMSQFFTSGGQIIGTSASASILPMNTQG